MKLHSLRHSPLFALSVCALSLFALGALVSGCESPTPGPDKAVAGGILGAGWGAGAGAIVGNQVSNAGAGVAVGAGLGAAAGLLAGGGYDIIEGGMEKQLNELATLRAQNETNGAQLAQLQTTLDRLASSTGSFGVFQVFFDIDSVTMKSGAIANLEVIAESIKSNPSAAQIMVVGNADDSGNPEYNQQLAEARAREVSGYLMRRGISRDQIKVKSVGSANPIAPNTNPTGRQLNRRVDVYIGK